MTGRSGDLASTADRTENARYWGSPRRATRAPFGHSQRAADRRSANIRNGHAPAGSPAPAACLIAGGAARRRARDLALRVLTGLRGTCGSRGRGSLSTGGRALRGLVLHRRSVKANGLMEFTTMAQIVAGFGVPHTPVFPLLCQTRRPRLRNRQAVRARRRSNLRRRGRTSSSCSTPTTSTPSSSTTCRSSRWASTRPLPAPNDEPRDVPIYTVPSALDLAAHIRAAGIEAGFDVGMTQNFSVDHSVDRAAAFPHAGHEYPGHSVLHQRTRAAAALGAALLCARPGGRPRHRVVAGEQACRGDGLAAASRSKSAARAWRPAAPTACPIQTGARASSSFSKASRSTR